MKSTIYVWSTVAALLATAITGCEVTSEKIQKWKQSEKGAAKIRAALRDTSQKMSIRVEAAEALGEQGLFVPLADDLKFISAEDRTQVTNELVRRLLGRMKGPNPKETTKVQLQAKDTLFSIRELASDSVRKSVEEELVRWLLGDLTPRSGGEHSSDKIIKAIGVRAGPLLAEEVATDPESSVTLATHLRESCDVAARDAAAVKLIELANKQNPPLVQTFHALGKVGSTKAIEYLGGVASRGEAGPRVWALRALALYPQPTLVPLLKTIASDASLKGEAAEVRDEAFTVLEKISDPSGLEALIEFLASKEDKVRYRAVEAIISGWGVKGLTKLLENLPSGYTYARDDVTDFIENDIVDLGKDALAPMREELSSKSWIARLVAARVLGRLGTVEDIPALEKLAGDGTRLRGWNDGATVGSEARAAAEKLRTRN